MELHFLILVFCGGFAVGIAFMAFHDYFRDWLELRRSLRMTHNNIPDGICEVYRWARRNFVTEKEYAKMKEMLKEMGD